MYELKRLLTRHIEENVFKYFFALSMFSAGIILGVLFSGNVTAELSDSLTGEISAVLEGVSQGSFDKIQILKVSFLKNLRFFLLILVSGFSTWLLPISFGTLAVFGFSVGFTITYMAVNFGGTGLEVALVSLAFAFLINIPIYIILSVVAFNNGRNRKHSRTDGGLGTYALIFVLLFIISLLSVGADAFVVPYLISIICS